MSTTITILSVIVASIACIVGILGAVRSRSHDDSQIASDISSIKASQDFIIDDIKEIKVEFHSLQNEIASTKNVAYKALNSAEAANTRLDAYGVRPAASIKNDRKHYEE